MVRTYGTRSLVAITVGKCREPKAGQGTRENTNSASLAEALFLLAMKSRPFIRLPAMVGECTAMSGRKVAGVWCHPWRRSGPAIMSRRLYGSIRLAEACATDQGVCRSRRRPGLLPSAMCPCALGFGGRGAYGQAV